MRMKEEKARQGRIANQSVTTKMNVSDSGKMRTGRSGGRQGGGKLRDLRTAGGYQPSCRRQAQVRQ